MYWTHTVCKNDGSSWGDKDFETIPYKHQRYSIDICSFFLVAPSGMITHNTHIIACDVFKRSWNVHPVCAWRLTRRIRKTFAETIIGRRSEEPGCTQWIVGPPGSLLWVMPLLCYQWKCRSWKYEDRYAGSLHTWASLHAQTIQLRRYRLIKISHNCY